MANRRRVLVESVGPRNSVTYTGEANVNRSLAFARIRSRDAKHAENTGADARRSRQIRLGARSEVDAVHEAGWPRRHDSQLGSAYVKARFRRPCLHADAADANLEKGIAGIL